MRMENSEKRNEIFLIQSIIDQKIDLGFETSETKE